jgi:ribonuclease T2
MSLSWSPGFCATPAGREDTMQCGGQRPYGFVLHGLWPQYEQKGWPEDCATGSVDDATVESMLNIMPSPTLVRHEWQKHGTCSGLDAKDYFEEAAEAFQSVKIPAAYQAPKKVITVSPDQMLQEFVAANPQFGQQGFAVLCSGNGRYLQEVRACLDKDLAGRSCNREVLRDACKSDEMIMRPVR